MANTLRQLANSITSSLHTIEIDDGTQRMVWTDNAREELKTWFRDISGEYTGHSFSQLDECYTVLSTLCNIIEDNTTSDDVEEIDEDKLDELIEEYQWSYVMNADLLAWVQEDLTRIEDVDAMLDEGYNGIVSAITGAMYRSRVEMAASFVSSMRERIAQ